MLKASAALSLSPCSLGSVLDLRMLLLKEEGLQRGFARGRISHRELSLAESFCTDGWGIGVKKSVLYLSALPKSDSRLENKRCLCTFCFPLTEDSQLETLSSCDTNTGGCCHALGVALENEALLPVVAAGICSRYRCAHGYQCSTEELWCFVTAQMLP